jgi:potassium efflux system protein
MSSRNRKPVRSSGFVQGTSIIVLVAIYFLIGAVPGKAAEQKTPEPQKVTAPQTPAAIPVAEVTMRATEVANILRRMNTLIDPSPQIAAIQKMLPEVGRNLELESSEAKRVLQDQPTLAVLQAGEQLWAHRQREMTRWLDLLTQRATQLQAALGKLADLQKTWSLTLDAAVSSKAPEPILQQIRATVAALEKVQTPLQAQPPRMLDLQSQVAQELALCESVLVEIGKAQEEAVGGFLKRETSPIWSPVLWSRGRAEGPARVRRVARGLWADISQYFSDSSKGLILHIGLFVIVALLFGAARWHVRRWRVTGESSLQAIAVFERPFSAALVVTLFAATSPYLPTVPIMRKIFAILELVPMIRLTKPVVNPVVGTGLYVLGVLFALNTAREAFAGALLIEQTVIVIEVLAGMAALGWVFTRGALRRFEGYGESLNRLAGLRAVAGLVLLILAICLVTGSLGYLRLSRLLLSTILAGAALALALFAYTRVALGVVAYLLRVWPLRLLRMVQHQSKLVERRIYRIFIWLAIAGWLARVLDYVGLFQPTLSLGQAILAARLERGAISISVGDVFLFFLAVWVSYLLSRFLRFVLQEDVYPRTRIGRGSSYAMSSLLHYVVLALGFVVGLGLLGVNLSKVTVLAGAFGVGIGFGLQSVVNNFVSGLILLFERPIHVGDTVEVGSLLGQVQRIGIRSSIVRTVHGAEIIVPNSQLVSEQVTNWTLSDQLRRIDLPVGVNYGADPKKVIELMEAVARAHPLVLQDPAPRGLFMGYGDSSINFELRAWTDQFSSWYQIRSDLTIAVFDAVKKEIGVSFPFPQREVRLLRDLEVAPSPKPGDSESSKSGGTNPKKLE